MSPDQSQALREQVARTEADLDGLRRDGAATAAEVDAAIRAFNTSDLAGAMEAFRRLDGLIARRRENLREEEAALRLEAARSKHAQATLFHPFEDSLAEPLLTEAAELAGDDVHYWIECGRARMEIGRARPALAAFERARTLAEKRGERREVSIALDGIGNALSALGDSSGALDAYFEAKDIAWDLLRLDPENANLMRDVSISLERIGEHAADRGDQTLALKIAELNLSFAREAAAALPEDPDWKDDLATALSKRGNARVAEGRPDDALRDFREALDIRSRLEALDPANPYSRRDVSLSHEDIGDVLFAQGDLPGAASAFAECQRIRRELLGVDPGNGAWLHEHALALGRLGDVCQSAGETGPARRAHGECLDDYRLLTEIDPDNAGWQRGAWIACLRMAECDPDGAGDFLAEALSRLEGLVGRNALPSADEPFLGEVRARLEGMRHPSPERPA